MHQIVGVVRRDVASGALRLSEERLPPRLRLAPPRRIELPVDSELGGRRKIQELLELRHGLNLAPTVERVDALLGSDDRVSVEVGRALLELREVFDAPERSLGAEEPLDVHAAKARSVDAVPELLGPDVAHEMRR